MSIVNKKCQVPTPIEIVRLMLDQIGYDTDLFGKKVLENSCGEGHFLVEIVDRYIQDAVSNGLSADQIRFGLQRDITGFELDKRLRRICIQNLNEKASEYNIVDINWNIKGKDALKKSKRNHYQYVIGNPPYLAYTEISTKDRLYLRQNFRTCQKGKPDYYYAFIESSIKSLANNGKMIYLIPGNFMKNIHSENLRKLILPTICKITNFSHRKLFSGRMTSSVIILCRKDIHSSVVEYEDKCYKYSVSMPKSEMYGKWVFHEKNDKHTNITFSDCFHASAPVATQLNRAFILKNYLIDQMNPNLLRCGNNIIETAAVRAAAGPKAFHSNENEKIIFPYIFQNGQLVRYDEEEYQKLFPRTYSYLRQFKKDLEQRDADKQAKWFEYGRSQLLTHLQQPKLMLSVFITQKPHIYILPENTVPYAGICVYSKSEYNINIAKKVLESEMFLNYAKNIGICTNGTSYRISSTDINKFQFPDVMLKE